MRIQRALARAGIASRRGAETLVAAGRVQVNGKVATTGQSVDPAHDVITVDGAKIGASLSGERNREAEAQALLARAALRPA